MTDKDKNINKVPNLRFPEFSGEWEAKKLGEVSEIIGGGTPETGIEEYWGGDIQWFTPTEIKSNFISKSERTITELGLKKSSAKILPKGTILLTTRATIGDVAIALNECSTNQGFQSLIVKENYDNLFLFNWIKQNKYELTKRANGSTFPEISKSEIEKIEVFFPNLSEQQKISSFLSLLDEKITSSMKTIKELNVLKSALAKKIFAQELRFKDDNGNEFEDWEEKELKEVMSVPEKIKPTNIDRNKLLTVKLHLKGVQKNENTETLSLGATNYFVRRKGQFIYGKQNLFNGAFDIIPDELDGFLSSGDVPSLNINHSKINAFYLLYFLGREEFYKRLEDVATGSGSKRIHEATLLDVKIDFPKLEEQQKIAQFLSSIDAKIDIENQILQKLEEQKKYFLANLFI